MFVQTDIPFSKTAVDVTGSFRSKNFLKKKKSSPDGFGSSLENGLTEDHKMTLWTIYCLINASDITSIAVYFCLLENVAEYCIKVRKRVLLAESNHTALV